MVERLGAVCFAAAVAVALVLPAAAHAAGSNVEVIVNSSLYASGLIDASLEQYLADLRVQGFSPTLTTKSFPTPGHLKVHLAGKHNTTGLAGAVLIGDLPSEQFERYDQFNSPGSYERFACDHYFMDLDGVWEDNDENEIYDTHSGDMAPEIWVGRLKVSPLVSLHAGRTEASLLNDYFQKDHDYRTAQLASNQNGMAYVDDDWRNLAAGWAGDLAQSVAGHVDRIDQPATTTAADYLARLQSQQYESVLLAAHSSATSHSFKVGSQWTGGTVTSSELAAANPQALFYNLFACASGDFTRSGYIGGEYVFGTVRGLLAVGSTKSGGMLSDGPYYQALGEGDTFGQAFLDWWGAKAADGIDGGEQDWHYGMTIIGDPTLVAQHFIPEPATLLMVALAAAAIARRRQPA